jgi:hypothetical protein
MIPKERYSRKEADEWIIKHNRKSTFRNKKGPDEEGMFYRYR